MILDRNSRRARTRSEVARISSRTCVSARGLGEFGHVAHTTARTFRWRETSHRLIRESPKFTSINNTPSAIRAAISLPWASPNSVAIHDAIDVPDRAGGTARSRRRRRRAPLPPSRRSRAPRARNVAPNRPILAVGRTTSRITCQRVAPRDRLASTRSWGTTGIPDQPDSTIAWFLKRNGLNSRPTDSSRMRMLPLRSTQLQQFQILPYGCALTTNVTCGGNHYRVPA